MKNSKYDENYLVDFSGQQNKNKLRRISEGQSMKVEFMEPEYMLSTDQAKKVGVGKRTSKQQYKNRKNTDNV